jgi:hypothetical protein
MRACSCCRLPAAPTPENLVGFQVSVVSYLLLWNCACGSTLAVTLWESEE